MEIKSIRDFLTWVNQEEFVLDEENGNIILKNGEKAEDVLTDPYTMEMLVADVKKHSYLWEGESQGYTVKKEYQFGYLPEIPAPTTDFGTARSYMFQRMQGDDGIEMEKIGGEDYYNVISVYLDICHPLYIDGMENPNLSHIYLDDVEKVAAILEYHPDLYLAPDEDEERMNPLGDYLDEYWGLPFEEMEKEDFIPYIKKMAAEFFQNTNLYILDNFFLNYPQEFRTALRDILGYDGVIVRFTKGCHAIAWFPEQIKSIYNQNPTVGRKINQ